MLKFGIEIEFMAPAHLSRSGVAEKLTAGGAPCYDAGYTHTRVVLWKIVTDGSLTGGNGMELVSPPLPYNQTGFEAVQKACAVLAQIGGTVNRSCGLHVHIDVHHMSLPALRKLAVIYVESEDVIDQLLPTSRRGNANNYCRSVKALANLSQLATASNVTMVASAATQQTKYVKLNFLPYFRQGTVEFRHHSGTIDAEKIIKWVTLCVKMLEAAVREQGQPIAAPVSTTRPRGRARRVIYDLMARPEGVTTEEVRVALNRRSQTSLPPLMRRLGISFRTQGRRNGHRVFYLEMTDVVTNRAPATLDALCERLALSDEDKVFWAQRAAALAAGTAPAEVAA